jgi:hypothetical protein
VVNPTSFRRKPAPDCYDANSRKHLSDTFLVRPDGETMHRDDFVKVEHLPKNAVGTAHEKPLSFIL